LPETAGFSERKTAPRWGALLLVGVLHLIVLAALARALAPDFTTAMIDRAASVVAVTVSTTPPPPPMSVETDVREAAAAPQGRKATPKEIVAPRVPRPPTAPIPRASSSGTAASSGAREEGEGTGAGGEGAGAGAGRDGTGTGGVPVTKPVKIAGAINDARDYPVPPGGRAVRVGHSVTIVMTVGVDGRASNCRVISPSPDPTADRITCELAVERFRFRPARDADGNPVPATYGWRQSWFAR
jgi:protein TonB